MFSIVLLRGVYDKLSTVQYCPVLKKVQICDISADHISVPCIPCFYAYCTINAYNKHLGNAVFDITPVPCLTITSVPFLTYKQPAVWHPNVLIKGIHRIHCAFSLPCAVWHPIMPCFAILAIRFFTYHNVIWHPTSTDIHNVLFDILQCIFDMLPSHFNPELRCLITGNPVFGILLLHFLTMCFSTSCNMLLDVMTLFLPPVKHIQRFNILAMLCLNSQLLFQLFDIQQCPSMPVWAAKAWAISK